MTITLHDITGQEIGQHLDSVASLRLDVFRDFPYSYDGDVTYERAYLEKFLDTKDALIVIAEDSEHSVIGASTGLPMSEAEWGLRDVIVASGMKLEECFYFAESMIRQDFRGRGIGVAFFQRREEWARALHYKWAVFCSVVRSPDEYPENYQPLDDFWKKRGFEKTHFFAQLTWKQVDEDLASAKPMQFWRKAL